MATTRYSGHFFDFRRKMSFFDGAKKVTKSRDNGISLRKQEKARKPAYQVTISERNRCSEAKRRMRYTQCSKGFAKQRLSYLPLADMAQTLGKVKERVGVDTLFAPWLLCNHAILATQVLVLLRRTSLHIVQILDYRVIED